MENNEYISDEQVVKRANAAVKLALEKKKITEAPIVVYDRKSGTVNQLNSDGSKTVVGKRKTTGRYSERLKKQ